MWQSSVGHIGGGQSAIAAWRIGASALSLGTIADDDPIGQPKDCRRLS